MNVPLFELNFDDQETQAVLEVMQNRWLSMGPKVDEFEKKFAKRLNLPHAVAVNNCTSALTLAYRSLGLGPGDEIIMPSWTFVATANAAAQLGAKVVFADITSEDDWTISVEDIQNKITPKTKLIAPVHYAGYMPDMLKIREIADQFDLAIVEDGAHSPGGHHSGIQPGELGDALCLSFFANKNMTTGEGGMVLCKEETLYLSMKHARSHGITSSSYERSLGKDLYDVVDFGYNFRMTDINAAIGCVQIEKLDEDFAIRQQKVNLYREILAASDIQIPFSQYQGQSSNYIFPILLPHGISKEKVRNKLSEAGIQTSFHYPPAHLFEHYQKSSPVVLKHTESISSRALTLPLFKNITDDQIKWVCDNLVKAIHV